MFVSVAACTNFYKYFVFQRVSFTSVSSDSGLCFLGQVPNVLSIISKKI